MKKLGKNAAAYAAERLVLQETFFKLKIRGLSSRAASNRERVITYNGGHTVGIPI